MNNKIAIATVILFIMSIVAISGCTSEDQGQGIQNESQSEVINNISAGQVVKDIMPLVTQYNGSKGSDQSKIPIKGKVLLYNPAYWGESQINETDARSIDPYVDQSDSILLSYGNNNKALSDVAPETLLNESFAPDTKITVFVVVNRQKQYVGKWRFSSGKSVSGYRYVSDVIVVYWPEKTVVGWHKIKGSAPDSKMTAPTNTIEIAGYDGIGKWIGSLPRET